MTAKNKLEIKARWWITHSVSLYILKILLKRPEIRWNEGWVFPSQQRSPMLTLLKSLFIPLLEYWCLFWKPWNSKDIEATEAIQRTFKHKTTEVQHINHWERLHKLKLYSLQRCRERYIIITIQRITQHLVSNTMGTMGHKRKTWQERPVFFILFNAKQAETQNNTSKKMQ